MKNDSYICHALYLRNSIACDHVFWYICVKWWFLQVFFSFCQKLDFLGCYLGKRAKMAQNDKKFCLSRFISQKPYIMQLSFIVHLCKMIISRHFFFFSKNCKSAKNSPKFWEKILSAVLRISGTIHLMVFVYGTQVQNEF